MQELPDILKLLDTFLLDSHQETGYILIINGKRFETHNGKKIWNKPHHAKAAFKNAFSSYVHNAVRRRLINEGITEYYYHQDYKNAWDNFLKEIHIEIKELK